MRHRSAMERSLFGRYGADYDLEYKTALDLREWRLIAMAQTPPSDDFIELAGMMLEPDGNAVRSQADELIDLYRENEQLRRALTSRATTDQAKGILMATHGGTPEDAFDRLVKMSQESNTSLRDVAKAIVYEAQSDTD